MGRTRLDVLVDLKGLDGAHGQNHNTWSLLVPSFWTRYSLDLNKSRATRLKDGATRWLQLRSAVFTKLTKREKQQKNNILGGKTGWAGWLSNRLGSRRCMHDVLHYVTTLLELVRHIVFLSKTVGFHFPFICTSKCGVIITCDVMKTLIFDLYLMRA